MLVKKNSLMQPFLVGSPGGRGCRGDGQAKRISDQRWATGFPECKFNKLLEGGSVENSVENSVKSSEKPRCYARRSDGDDGYVGLCDQFPSLSWIAPTASQALEGIICLVDQLLWEQACAEHAAEEAETLKAGELLEGIESNVDC